MQTNINLNALQQVNHLFWVWIYPLAAVLVAGSLSAWAGNYIPDRDEDNDGRPDLGPLILRGLLQAFVFGAALFGSVAFDKFLHGEPAYMGLLAKTVILVLGIWIGFRIVETFLRFMRYRLLHNGSHSAAAVLPLLQKFLKAVLGLLAAVVYLDNLGVNVSALLAGLGVGGLAVALAAQRTVENLFGGIMLILDQPVRVGDFCSFGGRVGTVEEIGLRSTRIRTLDRTVVAIPNGNFSQMELENYAVRDKIWMKTVLGLRYETTGAQLRAIMASIKKMLVEDERVDPDPARIRFVGFGAFSLDLEIFAYIKTSDINEFLAIREDINLRLIDLVEAGGSGFAFPSQTLYMGKDGGLPAPASR